MKQETPSLVVIVVTINEGVLNQFPSSMIHPLARNAQTAWARLQKGSAERGEGQYSSSSLRSMDFPLLSVLSVSLISILFWRRRLRLTVFGSGCSR